MPVTALEERRLAMINHHLLARGIRDPAVLAAMSAVPREDFVNRRLREQAYDDNPLPIGDGQTISQPYIVAYMAEALELSPSDSVLEIGTGSGYGAAVLSRIVRRVVTLERLGSLADQARERLACLGYDNVTVHEADGTLGWSVEAPYDGIVVTAAAPRVPGLLLDQLAVGGRLVVPVGDTNFVQTLVRIRRIDNHDFRREELCSVRFVPLIGRNGWQTGH